MLIERTKAILEPPAKFVSKKVITLEVKAVEKFVPDRLLLFYLNTLDKHVPARAIDGVIDGLDRLPPKVRSTLITAVDGYVPDSVASSRKVSAVVSAVYKYVPDRIIPPEASEDWANVKTRFHIPTLLRRDDKRSTRQG
ncbi:MAG: hypothetical protein V3R58_03745 [candidate division NC10 bacterium]